jgi:mRNA-degrading endonuclease RelE of RelBE toxin-antitoxin system
MNPYRVVYSPTVRRLIRRLPPAIKTPIRRSIEALSLYPDMGKCLQRELEGFRSLRYKKYRIIYRITQSKTSGRCDVAGARLGQRILANPDHFACNL